MSIKFYMILVAFLVTVMISCKKQSFLSGKDHISHTEFNPVIDLTSASAFTPNFPYGYEPHPRDSATSCSIDINNDSDPDFQITVKHWYNYPEHTYYNYEMTISGTTSSAEIATIAEFSTRGRFYTQDESIDRKAEWNTNVLLMFSGTPTNTSNYSKFIDTQYIGLRIKKGSRYNYCWLKINGNTSTNSLKIISCGYNQSHGNNILAGQ